MVYDLMVRRLFGSAHPIAVARSIEIFLVLIVIQPIAAPLIMTLPTIFVDEQKIFGRYLRLYPPWFSSALERMNLSFSLLARLSFML